MKDLLKGVIFKLQLTRRIIGNWVKSQSTGMFLKYARGLAYLKATRTRE